jgi:hypothetical protein
MHEDKDMEIINILSFLVSPGKNLENPPSVKGSIIPLNGNLYNMINDIFKKSDNECDIAIHFMPEENGVQNNEVRNNLIAFINDPSVDRGRSLGERLRDHTNKISGMALFFIILGKENNNIKIVLSRFPAGQGIMAEPHEDTLRVDFIERVFMKNSKYYKAALYNDSSLVGGFWKGVSIDKQVNEANHQIARYWIHGFLKSNFETTSKQGTRLFAIAIREAARKASSVREQEQLIALAILSGGLSGQDVTINAISNRYNLSEKTKELLFSQLPYRELISEHFILDEEELSKQLVITSVELDTGAILTAPPDLFDHCFVRENLAGEQDKVRFIADGIIISETIRGRR